MKFQNHRHIRPQLKVPALSLMDISLLVLHSQSGFVLGLSLPLENFYDFTEVRVCVRLFKHIHTMLLFLFSGGVRYFYDSILFPRLFLPSGVLFFLEGKQKSKQNKNQLEFGAVARLCTVVFYLEGSHFFKPSRNDFDFFCTLIAN